MVRESSALEQYPELKNLTVEARGRLSRRPTHLPDPNPKQTLTSPPSMSF